MFCLSESVSLSVSTRCKPYNTQTAPHSIRIRIAMPSLSAADKLIVWQTSCKWHHLNEPALQYGSPEQCPNPFFQWLCFQTCRINFELLPVARTLRPPAPPPPPYSFVFARLGSHWHDPKWTCFGPWPYFLTSQKNPRDFPVLQRSYTGCVAYRVFCSVVVAW